MTLVPVADLEREVGPFDEADRARALGFLEEASDLALELTRKSWTDTAGANPAPVSVRLAVKAAARRAFNEDPDDITRESLGDWTGSRKSAELDQTGVYFTAAEEARVLRAAGRRAGAYSIRTPSPYEGVATETVYVPVDNPNGSPIPFLTIEDLA